MDLTFKEAQMKKRKYKYFSENNKEINYYQYDIDGNKCISIATIPDRYIQNTYWIKNKIEGSYENPAQVPHLILGCSISIGFSFSHIKPNYYKLYINEKFEKNGYFKEGLFLKVIINENNVVYYKKFPSQQIYHSNSNNNKILEEDFICFIIKEDFENAIKEENCSVQIWFSEAHSFEWKRGWYIDGGSLKEITKKEMDNEIEIINKKLEEEEKKMKEVVKDEDEDEEDDWE